MAGSGGHGFARGDNAIAHCERCGFKYKRKELIYDGQYRDLLVCRDCWDPKHPQDFLPAMHDPVSIRDPRSDADTSSIAAGYTDITWPPATGLPGGFGSPGGGSGEAGGGGVYTQPAFLLGLKFQLSVSQFGVLGVNGGVNLEAPSPTGRIIAMTESTGTERPVQLDSDDDITTWTPKTFDRNPNGSNQVPDRLGIAYNGSGTWVCVGSGLGAEWSTPFTSTNDGFDWVPRTSQATVSETTQDVCWGASVFVSVGTIGFIETSPDGITWTQRVSGISTDLNAVGHNGSDFYACGASGVVLTCENGTDDWDAVGAVVGSGTELNGIAFNGSRIFVAAADGRVYWSDDAGDTWTANTGSAFGVALFDVASDGDSIVVAVGNEEDVYLSTDNGESFTVVTGSSLGFNADATFACVIYDNGEVPYGFIIAGDNGSGQSYLATSDDGSSWTLRVEDGVDYSHILSIMGEDTL